MAIVDYWLAAGVLATLQAGLLTFRIERERNLEEKAEQTWFPVSDWLNAVGLATLVVSVFVFPVLGIAERWTAIFVGFDAILVAAFPFALAGHYKLLGGARHERGGRRYFPRQEQVVVAIAAVLVAVYAMWALVS